MRYIVRCQWCCAIISLERLRQLRKRDKDNKEDFLRCPRCYRELKDEEGNKYG